MAPGSKIWSKASQARASQARVSGFCLFMDHPDSALRLFGKVQDGPASAYWPKERRQGHGRAQEYRDGEPDSVGNHHG